MAAATNLEVQLADLNGDHQEHDQPHDTLLPTSHSQPTINSHSNKPRPTAFLDGLRGLAAFIVYINHHESYLNGNTPSLEYGYGHASNNTTLLSLPIIRLFVTGGPGAVAIFFVLSGYVLSLSPLTSLTTTPPPPTPRPSPSLTRTLLKSTLRRPTRLYTPVLAISLLVALTFHLPLNLSPDLLWPRPTPSLPTELWRVITETAKLTNLLLPHELTSQWFPYIPPAWTMAKELEGSLLLYAVLWGVGWVRSGQGRTVVLAVLGVGLLGVYRWSLGCFLLGAGLASWDVNVLHYHAGKGKTGGRGRITGVVNWGFVVVGLYLLGQPAIVGKQEELFSTPGWGLLARLIPQAYWDAEYWRWWQSIGAVMLVYAVLRLKGLQHFFTRPALRYLGLVSFSLYLVHIPILWTFGDFVYRIFGHVREETSPLSFGLDGRLYIPAWGLNGLSLRLVVAQLFILPVTLFAAHLATIWIDAPSIKLSKYLVELIPGFRDR